jgi:hypothetical protein
MWPHLLAAALATGAVVMAARALRDERMQWAALAGFLGALSAGVRYQNAFLVGCLGFGLLVFAKRRAAAVTAFSLAAALPFGASSIMNRVRLGSWNPISKGSGYLPMPGGGGGGSHSSGWLVDTVTMAWARMVDYSARPPLTGTHHASVLWPNPESGAFVVVTAVKKAWLQSSPWIVVGLLVLLLCWWPGLATRYWKPDTRRELRFLSLLVFPVLAMFAATGPTRTDGLCFNQRYFCELVPMVAIALAWGIDGLVGRPRALLAGGLVGSVVALASLQFHHLAPLRHYLVMYLPLMLALLLAVAWGAWIRADPHTGGRRPYAVAALVLLGASLGWGCIVHLGDDLPASRILRHSREDYLRQLEPFVTDGSAVLATGAIKDALGPLQLRRDVVIAVPGFDLGERTKDLVDALLARGRRVLIMPNSLPRELLDPILEGRRVRTLGRPVFFIEVARETDRGAPAL